VKLIDNGKEMFIKKTTLCWLLAKRKEKISTDRLRRFISNSTTISHKSISDCTINSDIYIGDWGVFKHYDNIVVGQVIGFQYINATGKQKKYTWDVCPVTPPAKCNIKKGINVIGNWFLFNNASHTLNLLGKFFFINIDCYASHIEPPDLVANLLSLSKNSFDYIKALIGQAPDPLI
jgi:hypothetical protein